MESIWRKYSCLPEFPELTGEHKTDVLIIGGGLAGILTAFMLKQHGADCILLEKDKICCGTSENTTAKITYQHGLIYSRLLKSNGLSIAKGYLEANKMAFRQYEELCQNIDCDFEYKDSFIYSLNNDKKLEDEVSALNKIGCNSEFCNNLPLPFNTSGAVKIPHQAQFNPLKFISAIAENLPIYENSFVREMKGNTAVTDKGKVTADHVAVATHFPFINKHGSYFLKLYQSRSYVLALENAPNVDGIYLDKNETGFSFRNYKNYLLIGGGSHRTGKQSSGWNEIRHFAKLYYPTAKEYCFWAAQDCISLDKMPYIGKCSNSTGNIYTASGFNKWGITGSMLSAVLLSDMITGRKNDFADIFSPSRSILRPQLFVNAFEAAKGLFTPSKKRCPHLGCSLKWNSAEHSWDCPCHGSRFDENGKVLDNPTNGNLK
ncbi:MAG: FAD-dependent oxidoreductase [Ruminococcus sp.]